MSDKYFLDTNVCVYLFNTGDELKRLKCREMIVNLQNIGSPLTWSTQVIQEFYNVMTGKMKMEPWKAKKSLLFFRDLELITNNLAIIDDAMEIHQTHNLSFWDSLIVSAARAANCSVILSEDLNHGQRLEGMTIKSPFK